MRGDDAAGPCVIDRIAGRINAECFDAGTAPENYLEKIVKAGADTLVIVDAVTFGGEPGDVRLIEPGDLAAGGISTHALSLDMVSSYINARCNARVLLIGIQPRNAGMGEPLSAGVAGAVESVAGVLSELC